MVTELTNTQRSIVRLLGPYPGTYGLKAHRGPLTAVDSLNAAFAW